jgi:IPT/TIG domain
MHKRSLLPLCLLALGLLLAVPAGALAAKPPVIKSVSPKTLNVGDTLTVRGSGFKPGKGRNTLVFTSDGLYARAKAFSATRTTLKVQIPAKLQAYMKRRGGKVLATRFQIRVAARGSKFTPKRRSPLIGPAPEAPAKTPPSGGGTGGTTGTPGTAVVDPSPDGDCDLDGVTNGLDADDDNDLLDDATETGFPVYKTDPCDPDSDGDGAEDGYEYQSAKDLNDQTGSGTVPYPGKKPYPNPLFIDAGTDYDGDGILLGEEYAAWIRYEADGVLRAGRPTTLASLLYSDGTQRSRTVLADPGTAAYQDFDGDGELSDDERDVDFDVLANWDELRGRLSYGWWKGGPYKTEKDYWIVPFAGLDFLDPDSDGDAIADGADDQDHDHDASHALTNVDELSRALTNPSTGTPLRINPYNPCLPDPSSRSCTRHPPFENAPAPFDSSSDPAFPTFPAPYSYP